MAVLALDVRDYLLSARATTVAEEPELGALEWDPAGGAGEWMVDGSPGKLLREYNELVDNSNRLDWSFP